MKNGEELKLLAALPFIVKCLAGLARRCGNGSTMKVALRRARSWKGRESGYRVGACQEFVFDLHVHRNGTPVFPRGFEAHATGGLDGALGQAVWQFLNDRDVSNLRRRCEQDSENYFSSRSVATRFFRVSGRWAFEYLRLGCYVPARKDFFTRCRRVRNVEQRPPVVQALIDFFIRRDFLNLDFRRRRLVGQRNRKTLFLIFRRAASRLRRRRPAAQADESQYRDKRCDRFHNSRPTRFNCAC